MMMSCMMARDPRAVSPAIRRAYARTWSTESTSDEWPVQNFQDWLKGPGHFTGILKI